MSSRSFGNSSTRATNAGLSSLKLCACGQDLWANVTKTNETLALAEDSFAGHKSKDSEDPVCQELFHHFDEDKARCVAKSATEIGCNKE